MTDQRSYKRKTIFIVEGDESVGDMLAQICDHLGYAALYRCQAHDIWRVLRSIRPDLITMDGYVGSSDYDVGSSSGLNICKAIKQEKEFRDIPIIFMSDQVDIFKRELEEVGIRYFLSKPFRVEELADLINQILN